MSRQVFIQFENLKHRELGSASMQRKREHFLQLPMHQFSLPCSQQIVEMIYTILNVAFYTQGVTLNDLQLKDRDRSV